MMQDTRENWIGTSETRQDVVTPGLVSRYRAVIGADGLGNHVPYGLHWCTCLPDTPMAELGEDGHPKSGGFLPPSPLPRRMWASSQVEFLSPIRVGQNVVRLSRVADIAEKTGRSGNLLFVMVDHMTKADGKDAVRETQTIVYRDMPSEPATLKAIGPVDLDGWDYYETLQPDAAWLFRFSALTFNSHRIHYDLPYATQVEGYPELVVHGPLMASLLLRVATQIAEGRDILTFSFRGQSPAFCGRLLHLVARANKSGLDLAVLGPAGETVMSAKARLKLRA